MVCVEPSAVFSVVVTPFASCSQEMNCVDQRWVMLGYVSHSALSSGSSVYCEIRW